MLLFIFESIGTSELILIGIVALVLLGPRRLPELAKKAGKIMSDLKNTTNDFKNTWEKEVDLANERDEILETEKQQTVSREKTYSETVDDVIPEIKEIDKADFDKAVLQTEKEQTSDNTSTEKHDWL